MFADCLTDFADHLLCEAGNQKLSYGEVRTLAAPVLAQLPRPRALVVLRCTLDPQTLALHLALTAAGHVPLLLERDLSEPLLQDLVNRYRPDAIIDPPTGQVAPGPGALDPVALHPDLGLLLATSGSTGSPKLVRQSRRGVRANADSIRRYLGLTARERPLLHLPLSYSYGLSILHSHVLAGATLVLTDKSVMESGYWDTLREAGCTSLAGVPFHYQSIRRLGEAKLDIPTLTTLTQAGGRLDPRIVSHFANWADKTGRKFIVMYGQTEAGPRISWLPPEQAAQAPDSVGQAIPDVQIDLVDEAGNPVPDGTAGEMQVRSAAVMMGYAHQAADLALGDQQNGILRTGDMAIRGPDGLLRIVGRSSRLLKIYGLRVNLEEVEERLTLLGHKLVASGKDDELRLYLETDQPPDLAALRNQVVALFSLPPRGIHLRHGPPIPRSASGKIRAADIETAWTTAGEQAQAPAGEAK